MLYTITGSQYIGAHNYLEKSSAKFGFFVFRYLIFNDLTTV